MLYIFDMGGVLLDNVFELREILSAHDISLPTMGLYREPAMYEYSAGRIDEQEYWKRFNECHQTDLRAPQWGRFFDPVVNDETMGIILQLRDEGHRVVCGSNTIAPHWEFCLNQGYLGCFDEVYASYLIGSSKPEKEFFMHILSREGLSEKDCIFIDDSPENVRAAREMGIRSLLFSSAHELREQL